ncbi:MAG: hypothetical protein ACK501_07560 [Planctomycetota bacterium]|jgi:hypothetical protein
MDAFALVVAALRKARCSFLVTGVWGANYYAQGSLFVTQDQDLFLPLDPGNLLLAWTTLADLGLELFANEEPLDHPRDLDLARTVVERAALTVATDHSLLQVDLSLVMTGLEFHDVWARRRTFTAAGVEIPVASLADIVAAKHAANRPKDQLFLATHAEELRRLLRAFGESADPPPGLPS